MGQPVSRSFWGLGVEPGNPPTATACAVYFWARLLYAPLYYFKFLFSERKSG